MGSVLDFVTEFVGSAIGLPGLWLENIFGVSFLSPVVESIMNFLGFEDEEIYSTDVIAVRVYDEDLYTKVMQDLHLEYMTKGYGSIDYSRNFTKSGDSQFGKYYRTGKWDYMDYLPTGQINAVSLDTNAIVNVLKGLEGTDVFIVNIGNETPSDNVWAKYQLQQLYNYNIGTNTLRYSDNLWYSFTSADYQTSNNTIDVTITTIPIINAKTYKVTTVTVTPIDTLTDNKNTIITNDVVYTDNTTANILYKISVPISNTNTVVPKNSVKDSYTNEFILQEYIDVPAKSVVINVPMHANVQHYVVEYTRKDTGQFKYWIYNPQTNQYPIDNPNVKANNFEMFPIVMLRNNKVDVANMDKNSNRYKQTTRMLKSLGVDLHEITKGYSDNPDIDQIQDAFFLLAISPSDTHPIVSRCLYEMFDAIYDTTPFVDLNTSYSMAIKEEPYNAALVWNTGDVSVYNGVIYDGALTGDCNHILRTFTTVTNTYSVQVVTELSSNKWSQRSSVQQYTQKEILLDGVLQNTEISNVKTFEAYQNLIDYDENGNLVPIEYPVGTTKTLVKSQLTDEQGMRIQKQLTKTTYRRIDIRNFHAVSVIRTDKPRGKDLPLDDKNLLIPLAIPVVARLTLMEKTALLGRSVHLLFHAVQITYLKWYETEKFSSALQIVMIVIMIVVTVIVTVCTWGSATGPTLTAFSAAMAALKVIAIAVAVQLALKLIATYVDDPALKAALSLVVTAIGIYFSMGTSFGENLGLTALQLSSACVNAAAMYMGDIVAEDLGEFQSDVNDFTQKYDERSKQQEDAMKGLDMGSKSFDMVDLTTDIDMFNTSTKRKPISASLLNPTQFYYLATNQAAYNYDLMYTGLYDNTVHDFVANRLQLGIPGA
jgi:hypothetical protein